MSRFTFPDTHGDLLGAHISTKGGLHTVFDRAAEINASAIALFAKNGNQWKGKTMTDDDVAVFSDKRTVRPVLTHASYLINLATTNPEFHRKSIDAMIDELDRAERLGIHAVVLHPGAHMGAGVDAGIEQIARSLDQIHAAIPNHKVVTLLETAAGQGSCLGCTFEELGRIIALVDDKQRVGVCFDTCHVFASGYELRNRDDYERTIDALDDARRHRQRRRVSSQRFEEAARLARRPAPAHRRRRDRRRRLSLSAERRALPRHPETARDAEAGRA